MDGVIYRDIRSVLSADVFHTNDKGVKKRKRVKMKLKDLSSSETLLLIDFVGRYQPYETTVGSCVFDIVLNTYRFQLILLEHRIKDHAKTMFFNFSQKKS